MPKLVHRRKEGFLTVEEWQVSPHEYKSTIILECPLCKKKTSYPQFKPWVYCAHCKRKIQLN